MKTTKATCKFWSDSKGYGFVTANGVDMFCHYTALKGEGFKTLREGQEVTVEYTEDGKGPMVVSCMDWNKN
jgi:CspA family cold shock protein